MNNQTEFKTTLVGIAEVYDREVTPSLAKIYWNALREFTDDQVQRAFEQAVSTLKFFPKPSELREIIVGKAEERAHEAWGVLMDDATEYSRVRNTGQEPRYRSPPEILTIAKTLGGFPRINAMTERDLEFLKKDFVGMFVMKSERGEIKALPKPTENRIGHE